MIKSTLLALALLFSFNILKAQTALTIDDAVDLAYSCTTLNLNGLQSVSLTKKLNACNQLKTIHFTNNSLLIIEEGLALPSVTELDLTGTYVNTWELDKIARAFPNLTTLSLSNTGLYQIGSSLSGLTALEVLDLSNNQLSGLEGDLELLTNLKTLNVTNNKLELNIGAIAYMWRLEQLYISGNEKLSATAVARSISLNQNLKMLTIDYTPRIEAMVNMLSQSSIKELSFAGKNIRIPKNLSLLTKIERIGFLNSDVIIDEAGTISKNPQISELRFENAQIPGAIITNPQIKAIEIIAKDECLDNNLKTLVLATQLDTIRLTKSDVTSQQIEALKQQLPKATIISANVPKSIKFSNTPVIPIVPAAITTLNIEPNKPQEITVEDVVFAIPENAFLDLKGNTVSGPVKLQITVYNDPIQIALAGAPMTFDNNGKQENFSSQGMLRFDAFDQNGNALQPNPANLINVSTPNLQPNTDGDLYSYNEEQQKWETVSETKWGGLIEDNASQRFIDSVNRIDYKSLIRIQDDEPIYLLKTKFDTDNPSIQFVFPKYSETNPKPVPGVYRYEQKKNRIIKNQRFYIDTLISRSDLRKIKLAYKGYTAKKRQIKTDEAYYNEPRIIWNTQITLDEATDKLRLSFNLKDTTYSFPVMISPPYTKSNATIRSSRNANTKFEFERRMALAHDSIIKATLDRDLYKIRDSLANNMRNQVIAKNASRQGNVITNQMSRLGFQLGTFGLVNCDFFMRNNVLAYTAISDTVTDQNNVAYKATPTVRVVYVTKNAYIEEPSTGISLIGSKQIGIMLLSSTLIGVVEFVTDKVETVKKIRTINIEGKSPEEVTRLIND